MAGFAPVGENTVSVMVEEVLRPEEIDEERERRALAGGAGRAAPEAQRAGVPERRADPFCGAWQAALLREFFFRDIYMDEKGAACWKAGGSRAILGEEEKPAKEGRRSRRPRRGR